MSTRASAELALAQVDFDRAAKLVVSNDVPRSEYDRRQAALLAARADVTAALADVRQIRASLGLPPQPDGGDLGQVPPDLDQTFSSVLQAQAGVIQSAAQLGVIHSFEETPKQMLEGFEKEGDINSTFARLAADAPDVKQAEAKLEVAKRDLDQAELDLRYCDVIAEIDGVITRRNVNPGDNVQVGQGLMAIRSLDEIWVDANFKETQLGDLRIGQPVDLYVDMYGDRHVFKGRISGFTDGDRIDIGAAAAAERYGQLRQGGAATAGSDRPRELRSGQEPAVYRHVGCSLRLLQQAAHRTRCREVSAGICA